MKKFILFTLISILFLVTPLSNVSASTIYHVNHNSTGCWRASYDVTVSKNNIINVNNLSIQTSIGTYNKVNEKFFYINYCTSHRGANL